MKNYRLLLTALLTALLLLSGCVPAREPIQECTVIFEDNPQLSFSQQLYTVERFGQVTITVGVPKGQRIRSVNYEDYSLSAKIQQSEHYDYYTLTLHRVRYSAVIRLTTDEAYTTSYHPGQGTGETITLAEESPHLYFNTLPYREQFTREGYAPIGWNTEPDGSGTAVGFGSRIDHTGVSHLDLYMQWVPCSADGQFSYCEEEDGVTITGFTGSGNAVIPPNLGDKPVIGIAAGAFRDMALDMVVLPATLKVLEPEAFSGMTIGKLYFFDTLEYLEDSSFQNCHITGIHIQAVRDPVYSGSYFDTFPDKMDLLASLKDQRKMILFCGSSARFGYDSPMLEQAFPTYRVVNMGVYAYSNMRPQAELILQLAREGDILLSSPELDAIQAQFCGSSRLDREIFCMVESNYDLFARLDCRNYTGIFDAFRQFNDARKDMTARSYLESPASYDEDGNRQLSATYNLQGDYILYREDNTSGKTFGVKRAYYNSKYISSEDLAGLNRVYDAFAQKGVTVLFTYSPRSRISISEDSTPEAIRDLDRYLRDSLHASVIGSIEDSLMDPLYFHATDNHLSTNGVTLHTRQVIADLQEALN